MTDLADLEARCSLLHLDGIGPSRLRWLVGSMEPARVVDLLRRRRLPDHCDVLPRGVSRSKVEEWFSQIASIDGARLIEAELAKGHGFLTPDDDRWPFDDDPEPPALVVYLGQLDLLATRPSVGVVGTRRCTTVGRTVAHSMASELASAGVVVVSGLALGVDAAAHQGALDRGGAVLGVVASGLDAVYPVANRRLWQRVGSEGLLITEALAGTKPERWRFPARNRLIAALSGGVVIVESHHRGGSLITADEAADRGRPVFAVPGSVTNPAADGSNGLIVDGAIPVRDAADILSHMSLGSAGGSMDGGSMDGDLGLSVAADRDKADRKSTEHSGVTKQDASQPGPIGGSAELGTGYGDNPGPGVGDTDLKGRIRQEIAAGPCPIDHLVLSLRSSLTDLLAATYQLVASGEVVFDGGTLALCGGRPGRA